MIDTIYNWLKNYPGLLYMQREKVDEKVGGNGLFFRGVTVMDYKKDLLGKLRCRKRLNFRIRHFTEPEEGAVFFLLLGAWVEETAPTLGLDQTVCLKAAHCARNTDTGLGLWEADLEITYTEEAV